MSNKTVLIVEDDKKTANLVSMYLERDGFETVVLHEGSRVLEAAKAHDPIFVILDLMLPESDGWEICRALRSTSDVPILILTAREEELDRVLGFKLGADDYVVKPFSPRELVERVRAILRRTGRRAHPAESVLQRAELVLDTEKHLVTRRGEPVSLTPTEFVLLETLMRSPGRVFSRSQLLERLYPTHEAVVDRVIDVHVGKLRQKLEQDPGHPALILTVRGVGYRFSEAGARAERPFA